MLLIISFARFFFILYSSIARFSMFLWWKWKSNLFEAIHEMNLCYLYVQFVVCARWSDWFFYSILHHGTSKLMDSSQTGLQWKISLGLIFVLDSYDLIILLKQTISYRFFCMYLKRVRQKIMFCLHVPPIAFIRFPNSYITNFCPDTFMFVFSNKWMTLIFIQFHMVFWNMSIKMWTIWSGCQEASEVPSSLPTQIFAKGPELLPGTAIFRRTSLLCIY